MAECSFKQIKRNADNREIAEYLDYLTARLSHILENIDEDNLTDQLKKRIGG